MTENNWIIDSGASNHVTGLKQFFVNYTPIRGQHLQIANGKHITVKGKGDVNLKGTNGLVLKNVWHAPGLTSNLISLGQLEEKGLMMVKQADGTTILVQADKIIASIY